MSAGAGFMSAGTRDFCKDIVPAPTNARRGCAPPGASRQTWLLAPPHEWAYPAHTRGSFRFTTKGTKGVPGLRPWTPKGDRLKSVSLFSPAPPAVPAPPR